MTEQDKRHILIVDDEQSIRELVRDILEEEGYLVTAVANGIEALEALSVIETIDLIISDIRMPVMGGMKLLEKISEQNPFPPSMIFITGYSDIDPGQAKDQGVIAYLRKPMSINELISAVSNAFQTTYTYHRLYFRIATYLEINLIFKKNNETVCAQTSNLGRGGVFVSSEKLGAVGDFVRFQIMFRDNEARMVMGEGEIVWQRTERVGKYLAGMGIRFISLSLEDEKFVDQYIEDRKLKKI